MAYSKPENSISNYGKSAFKECKELWRGLYIRVIPKYSLVICIIFESMATGAF